MHYLQRANVDSEYPNMEFEDWFQLGRKCFLARLTKPLRKQAFHEQLRRRQAEGRTVHWWQARAFIYAAAGRGCAGDGAEPRLSSNFQWPTPPDPSWQLVVCCYPDGTCELDLVHQVSRRFWSEQHDFFEIPVDCVDPKSIFFTRQWYRDMGFDVIDFDPELLAEVGNYQPHLRLVV